MRLHTQAKINYKMRRTKKNLIIVPNGSQQQIAIRLGCNRNSVANALRYKDNGTELCNKIRTLAIEEFGGRKTSINI